MKHQAYGITNKRKFLWDKMAKAKGHFRTSMFRATILEYNVTIILLFVGSMLCNISHAQEYSHIINGQVLDQDGNPLSGVSISYSQHQRRYLIPIPYSPTYDARSSGELITDLNGKYTFEREQRTVDYIKIYKKGYKAESVYPTYVKQKRFNEQNPTLWLYKVIDDEKQNITRLTSKTIKLGELEKIYFSIKHNTFTPQPTDDSDLELSLYKKIGKTSHPMAIRALDGGIYCSRNDMPYAPVNGYEPGIIVDTIFRSSGEWIPFFYYSKAKNFYARLWLKLDARNKTISFHYAYNNSGSRYIDIDFKLPIKSGYRYLNTFASIERTVPLQREWWIYADRRKLKLITTKNRFHEIWSEFKNTDTEPYRDEGRGSRNGGLTRVNRFLAVNPLTPKDILSEIAETDDISVIRLLLNNPSLSQSDFNKLTKSIYANNASKFISLRNDNKNDWEDFLYNFIAK